ncbi:unnamed protein product [Mortierella alpina]
MSVFVWMILLLVYLLDARCPAIFRGPALAAFHEGVHDHGLVGSFDRSHPGHDPDLDLDPDPDLELDSHLE